MISRLFGSVAGMDDDGAIVVNCRGVGYRIVVHDRDRPRFNRASGDVEVFVRAVAKEPPEGLVLFGFLDADDRRAFERLCAVDGVGPATALRVLSVMTPAHVEAGVRELVEEVFSSVPGIGKKTAAKIVAAGWT